MTGAAGSFGPYVVYEELGTGGMATVHRAELTGMEGFTREVALKRMLPQLAVNEEIVKSFVREARLASFLQHANCAQTYELGNIGGTYFIAMELIRGRSLEQIMDRCTKLGLTMPVPIALAILNQMLDALDYAHNLKDDTGQPLGLIHRDVSPANILIDNGGVVKLIDFGIAKASAAGMQTQSFSVKGKFAYMAPEYVNLGKIDSRADLFAVGIIAHEILTGKPLFSAGEDFETLARMREMPIPPPSQLNPNVPTDIDTVILMALGRDPSERWQVASAMKNALSVETKRLNLEVVASQVSQWLEELFDDARSHLAAKVPRLNTPLPSQLAAMTMPAPKDTSKSTGPAQWLDDTNLNQMIGKRPGAMPRGATGAEPLWEMARATQPEPIVQVVPTGKVMVVEKRHNRIVVITLAALVVLGIAAAVYFLAV